MDLIATAALLLALVAGEAPPGAEACSAAFARGTAGVDAKPSAQRVVQLLDTLATACPALPEPLRTAAARAKKAPKLREKHLATGARALLPERCAPPEPAAPALALAKRCPPPPHLDLDPILLGDLDQGTYVFVLALDQALSALQLQEPEGRTLLLRLTLASALVGRARRSALP